MSNYNNIGNIIVVIPTIRRNSLERFLREWHEDFSRYNVYLILVEDNPEKTFSIQSENYPFPIEHYAWFDIENELQDSAWIMPRRNSGIRSFGFWKAYQKNPDMIVTLDDDCYPISSYISEIESDFFAEHWGRLYANKIEIEEDAWQTTVFGIRPRGLPYQKVTRFRHITDKEIVLNHGLWYNTPDLDAPTQLTTTFPSKGYFRDQLIERGKYFPMCTMNLAFKPEIVPAMYYLLMGEDKKGNKWGYDRFDDIWAGIFMKKIADHLGYSITSGRPMVWHDRASNVFTNLQKEANGIKVNETFWQVVDKIELGGTSVKECYQELSDKLDLVGEYWDNTRRAMRLWSDLF